MKQIDDIGNREPFRVPDGYFEALSERIIDNAKESENTVNPFTAERTLSRTLRSVLFYAALIGGLALLTYGLYRTISKEHIYPVGSDEQGSILAEAMVEEIDTYSLENELNETYQQVPDDVRNNYSFSDDLILENIDEIDIINDNL
jgi:hypothetical protein